MRNNHYRQKEEENKRMYLFWEYRMCLLGATLDVWCGVGGAAVVGATVAGATPVESTVVGAAEVGVTSGVQ